MPGTMVGVVTSARENSNTWGTAVAHVILLSGEHKGMNKRCAVIMPLQNWPYAQRCKEEGVKSMRLPDGDDTDNVWCCSSHCEEAVAAGAVEGETLAERCLRESDGVPIRAIKLYRTYTNSDLRTAHQAVIEAHGRKA